MVLRNLPRMSCDGSMFGADSVEIIDHDEFGRMPVVTLPPGKYTFKDIHFQDKSLNDLFLYRNSKKQSMYYSGSADVLRLHAVVIDGSDYELMSNAPESRTYEHPVKMGFILGWNGNETYISVHSENSSNTPASDPLRPQPGDTMNPAMKGVSAGTAILTATRFDIIDGADAR